MYLMLSKLIAKNPARISPKENSGAPQEYFHFLIASRHRSTSCFLAHFAPRKQCRSRKLGRKWKIPPQVTDICLLANSATPPHSPSLAPALRSYASHPPFPFATSEFKNKSAEILANPFPKK